MARNVDPPAPLTRRFRGKLLELLFDGRDEARAGLSLDLKSEADTNAKDLSQIDLAPDRAFFERYTGTYRNALRGTITIRLEGRGAILDAGEWKTTLGRKRAEDGTDKLVGTPPPWLDWPSFEREEAGGKVTLEMQSGGRKVVFERQASRQARD